MPRTTYRLQLNDDERALLNEIVSKGTHKSRKVINALILLNSDELAAESKPTDKVVAEILNVSTMKIQRVKKCFTDDGMDAALNGRKRNREYDVKADGDFEAKLVALSCGKPPEGHSQWSLRLLADKMVELEYIDSISHETVRRVLKKTKLNPGVASAG